ncbi:insulinase family protein [Pseudoalteromonas piscicida]|uniref:insulinase family protein n=1 Tax=Pseudoalteromonas piscicida TaxID=43662 RepID=UPI0005FA8573|nr:insulinase family protein [Pseudoalteromonas piscicida]KJZ05168.1 peptidase [Pseudoalteromonas piscicida]
MKLSNNDSRQYQLLTLDNGLRVLLINDDSTAKCAVSLTVNVGHFDDPETRQGMAHFLEHMLFLGTAEHPDSGGFSQFISQYGGQSNAWTGTEHSSYYFDCDAEQLDEALERFSQFFVSPLLSESDTEKEREAIDAEFKMKIKDDGRRIYQVHKETINPQHPFAKFSVGTRDTLADRNGNIASELRAFFNQYYQAQWMTLVIAAPQPLATLATFCSPFTKIVGSKAQKPAIQAPMYREQDLQLELQIKPRKHMQKLIVSFAMPNPTDLYRHKSVSFLAHLLGYEGKGSLYSILKSQGWINALSAGGGITGSNFRDFNISFALTDEGIEYYEDIVEMLFEYIALIKQNTAALPRLYQDKSTLLDIAFDNQEVGRMLDWVNSISVNMHHYEEEDFLYGDYRMDGFSQEQHEKLLMHLCPTNMRLVLIHPHVEINKKAKWYNTPYSVSPIAKDWIESLYNVHMPLPQMSLPLINPYLSAKNPLHDVESEQDTPIRLADQPGFEFWFKQDLTFRVTKGHFYLEIDSAPSVTCHKHMALSRLFADLFMDAVAERFYSAELAGLSYHINSHQGGLTLHTAGLTGNQITLVLELVEALLNQPIHAARFAEYKKQLIRHWKNHNKNKPVSELFSRLGAHLMPWNPSPEDLASALKSASFNEFQLFRKQFFSAIHVKAFMHGNWQLKHAEKLKTSVHGLFSNSEILEDLKRPLNELTKLTEQHIEREGSDYAFIEYFQSRTDSVKEKVTMMAINNLINQDYFEQLRTKEQLGYLVGAGYAPFNTRAGIAFYIQSPNFDSEHLLARHNQFLKQFAKQLHQLDEVSWQRSKESLLLHISEQDKNLRLRAQRLWISITNDFHQFDMQQRLIQALADLELEDILTYIDKMLEPNAPRLILKCN